MNSPVNYLARQQARFVIGEFFEELPTGTSPDELQVSLELHLAGFAAHCHEHHRTGCKMLLLARQRARTIYSVHFWHLAHSYWDRLRQCARLEVALLVAADAPADLMMRSAGWHDTRVKAVLHTEYYPN